MLKIATDTAAQQLDCDGRLRLLVDCAIYLSRASGTDPFNDAIPAGQDAPERGLPNWRLWQARFRISQLDRVE